MAFERFHDLRDGIKDWGLGSHVASVLGSQVVQDARYWKEQTSPSAMTSSSFDGNGKAESHGMVCAARRIVFGQRRGTHSSSSAAPICSGL